LDGSTECGESEVCFFSASVLEFVGRLVSTKIAMASGSLVEICVRSE
jgi:hypothetical protein